MGRNQNISIIKNHFGFSLVEMLAVVIIFSIVAGGLLTTATVGENSWQVNLVKTELQQELRKAMEWMINDLRQAGNNSITNVPADNSWYSTITFKTPCGVTAGVLDWNTDAIQFVLGGTNSNQLQRIEAGQTKVLAQNIQSIQFRRLSTDSDRLEVALQGQKQTLTGLAVDYQLSFAIQLRN